MEQPVGSALNRSRLLKDVTAIYLLKESQHQTYTISLNLYSLMLNAILLKLHVKNKLTFLIDIATKNPDNK